MGIAIDSAVRELARDLVRSERVDGVWYVNLPMSYPDGSFVTVRIAPASGGVRVSDAGFAYREADRLEAGSSFGHVAKNIASRFDASIADRSIFVVAEIDDLERAVMDVAAASWRIADKISSRVWERDEDRLSEPLRERLAALFGADRVEESADILGGSTTNWNVSAVVQFSDHKAVFQSVLNNANSINKASTAFRDLSTLPSPPKLIAVVGSKSEIGVKLPLLHPALILEEGQPDELYLKAAS
jgi:hypothetical protein